MKEKQKIRELIKPQMFDQNELDDKLVVPYCSSNYSHSGSDVCSCNGYSSSAWCVSSPTEEDDILL
ncbi:hypothetical protein U6A24_09205 [Aquimarina gracilis]|uniref:Natural product n=1 Tax=Aquimarina gracilis TaxID=874422 RepID=A0ABU5ZV01_9FLAO|nr:hypothetical protein [Aquimarina gracilis]MEB3345636.1 hypothetical protein [Aquimarina gracilis]